jgi:hypothetical protein
MYMRETKLIINHSFFILSFIGAAGVVGFGVCHAWLNESDDVHVYAVDRNEEGLNGLALRLGLTSSSSRLTCIVGDLSSDELGQKCQQAVTAALNGATYHHVVSAIGCSTPDAGGSVSASHALTKIKESYANVLFPNFLATTLFLEPIRDVQGASYTVCGGPFTHHCPDKALYNTSLCGGTLNHYGTILKFNTLDNKCRGNTLCCHYAIGYPDQELGPKGRSSFGDLLDKDFGPVSDCRAWGKTFVRVAKGTERLGFICMHDPDEAQVLVQSSEWVWYPDQHKFGPKLD